MSRKIVFDKNFCSGSPRIEGTRLTCGNIVQLLRFGDEEMSINSFLRIHSYLLADDIDEALRYCMHKKCVEENVISFCEGCTLDKDEYEGKEEGENLWEIAKILYEKLINIMGDGVVP